MKLRNYVVLMVVCVAVTILMPVTSCKAGWVYVGNGLSGGAPDSDGDEDSGTGWLWSWSYDASGASRGGDEGGCWVSASMTYNVYVSAWSDGGTSASASPPDGRWIEVYGESYYANIPQMGYRYLDYSRDAYVSGNVQIYGWIDQTDMGVGDDAYSSAEAYGSADFYDYGDGYVAGSVDEFTTGNTDYGVGGEATQDGSPSITESSGYYSISLDFTIDVYDSSPADSIDSEGGPSSFTASAAIDVSVDATASVDIGAGNSGRCDSDATASMGGYSMVSVDLHN